MLNIANSIRQKWLEHQGLLPDGPLDPRGRVNEAWRGCIGVGMALSDAVEQTVSTGWLVDNELVAWIRLVDIRVEHQRPEPVDGYTRRDLAIMRASGSPRIAPALVAGNGSYVNWGEAPTAESLRDLLGIDSLDGFDHERVAHAILDVDSAMTAWAYQNRETWRRHKPAGVSAAATGLAGWPLPYRLVPGPVTSSTLNCLAPGALTSAALTPECLRRFVLNEAPLRFPVQRDGQVAPLLPRVDFHFLCFDDPADQWRGLLDVFGGPQEAAHGLQEWFAGMVTPYGEQSALPDVLARAEGLRGNLYWDVSRSLAHAHDLGYFLFPPIAQRRWDSFVHAMDEGWILDATPGVGIRPVASPEAPRPQSPSRERREIERRENSRDRHRERDRQDRRAAVEAKAELAPADMAAYPALPAFGGERVFASW